MSDRDWLTEDGASALAQRIARHWKRSAAGLPVTLRLESERIAEGARGNLTCIRSDMINGYPRGWVAR